MNKPLAVISTYTLEHWDWTSPWTTGQGGSEQAHIELVERLAKRGYEVWSYVPLAETVPEQEANSVQWYDSQKINYDDIADASILINFRDPAVFDHPKPSHQKWYFYSQDTDYPWTPEQLEKVDRYLCLCPTHINYILTKYPQLLGRVFLSANGIRSDYIRAFKPSAPRDPNRLFYASSPDRGLMFLLQQFWRIKERNPDLKLRIAYGLNNIEKIISMYSDWRVQFREELLANLQQPDIEWLGRLPLPKLYDEWFQASIWPYPTDFPETSCITSMDAQACGTWPVCTNYWALEHNVRYGFIVDGLPQRNELIRTNYLDLLAEATTSNIPNEYREEMREWALVNHDWEKVIDQFSGWIEIDNA